MSINESEQPSRGGGQRPAANGRARSTVARHGRQSKRSGWKAAVGFVAGALATVLVAGAAVASVAAIQLSGNIEQQAIGADSVILPPMVGKYEGGFTMLITGSDTRLEQGNFGNHDGELNDVNMLLHVAEDQQSAVLVSIPRDLMVPLPACENGGPATATAMNTTLFYGGLDCTVRTVEQLTGLDIDFAGLITFKGVISMSNAVGGVDVCTTGPIRDPEAGLTIEEAGTHTLQGRQALAFLRARKSVGDGSDLGRISTQQVFLSSLVRKIKSEDTLGDPATVYSLAQAATQNMTLSRNLARLDVLASLALVLKDIPLDRIVMVQYPSTTGVTVPAYYTDKVAPIPYLADQLFTAIRNGQPIELDEHSTDNRGALVEDPNAPDASDEPDAGETAEPTQSASPAPSPTDEDEAVLVSGVKGQNAGQYTCVVGSSF